MGWGLTFTQTEVMEVRMGQPSLSPLPLLPKANVLGKIYNVIPTSYMPNMEVNIGDLVDKVMLSKVEKAFARDEIWGQASILN